MGKKKGEGKPSTNTAESKEGACLLGSPTFQPLENGRFKCVETGHELPAHSKDSYAVSKHCRLGLIDSAIILNKSPLSMFSQHPLSRSKLICKLTGDTINKSEEHIWKHVNGKRFLNMLEKKEAEKEVRNCATMKLDEEKEVNKNGDGSLKKKKKKKEKNKMEEKVGELGEEVDFWVPSKEEQWDEDDGGDRWCSDSEGVSSGEEDVVVKEDNGEDMELSKGRRKRVNLDMGASRKKKKKEISGD